MEAVKYELEKKLKDNLSTLLADYVDQYGEELELPEPAEYAWDYDPNFTVFNKYPVCMILGFRELVNDRLSLGLRVVSENSIAVVMLIIDQDPTKLDRKKSRYGEALVKFMKEFNSGTYERDYITMFGPNFEVNYTRAVRDEAVAAYLGSVWVFTDARVDTTL